MTSIDPQTVQPGWAVWTSDGTRLGTVIALEPDTIRVKKDGLLGGQVDVPRDAIDEVEIGRVDPRVSKSEL
jgi:hypothetical protein